MYSGGDQVEIAMYNELLVTYWTKKKIKKNLENDAEVSSVFKEK